MDLDPANLTHARAPYHRLSWELCTCELMSVSEHFLNVSIYYACFTNEIKKVWGRSSNSFSFSHFPVAGFDALTFFIFKNTLSLLAQPFHISLTSLVLGSRRTFFMGVTQGNLPLRACRGLEQCLVGHPSHVLFSARSLLRVDGLTDLQKI